MIFHDVPRARWARFSSRRAMCLHTPGRAQAPASMFAAFSACFCGPRRSRPLLVRSDPLHIFTRL